MLQWISTKLIRCVAENYIGMRKRIMFLDPPDIPYRNHKVYVDGWPISWTFLDWDQELSEHDDIEDNSRTRYVTFESHPLYLHSISIGKAQSKMHICTSIPNYMRYSVPYWIQTLVWQSITSKLQYLPHFRCTKTSYPTPAWKLVAGIQFFSKSITPTEVEWVTG